MKPEDRDAIESYRAIINKDPNKDKLRLVKLGKEYTPEEILGHMVNAAEGADDEVGREELEVQRKYVSFKRMKGFKGR